ncbi:MAG: Ppx/GppA family phosphatase [Rubellimicrobium sp.]|nr:Ppx/GppA family phosphatase [Rubellimicrobium sp.]
MDGRTDTEDDRWHPFGGKVIGGGAEGTMPRLGVVDVGSNSVRFVVFDGAARSPAYFYNEKVMCALGAGLSRTGTLNPEGRVRALAALRRFAALARGMDLPPITAFATAAVREARDGRAFCAEVARETGIELKIIPGDEEARLSAQGVLLGWPGSYGLVCDIGGSSMELADLAEGQVGRRLTSPLGPLKLREIKGAKALATHIDTVMADLHRQMKGETGMRLFLVGGSWRAIARIDMDRRNYPLTVLHEYRLTPEQVAETRTHIAKADLAAIRARAGLSVERVTLVPLAIQVLDALVRVFQPKDITVSAYGIREGMLYEQMAPDLRESDPLIEACRFAERKDARLPGFGDVLYAFVRPLFPDADWQHERLIRAACLLHDVSWRTHPDYRAETCFDNVTRANLGGLKHNERVFVGLALLFRYSSKRSAARYESLFGLVSTTERHDAEVLGRAMRLGAMLWLGAHDAPGRLEWDPVALRLRLVLERRAEPLFGEVADARLKALASAMGAEVAVEIQD